MEEFITACPRNCYSTCTFRVRVDKNRLIRILPYSGNQATPEGPCIKGLSYLERTYSPDRILHPLRKNKNGQFARISCDEAFEEIASRLWKIRTEYGPLSILWYKGSGMSGLTNEIGSEFWKEFGGATTTYGNLCWPAGLEAVRLTMGDVKHNVPWDLINAKTIILWGKNSAETNIQEISFIASARDKGARVIVIDPLRTPTADKADLLYSPLPGTDVALALATAKILIDEGLIDQKFIEENVKGFAEFEKSLTITPAQASVITGIPEPAIFELARKIGSGNPLTIIPGYGLQRHQNGGQTIRSILSLCILTGNIGKKGSGFNYANLQSYVYDNPKEPLSYYPNPEKDKPFRRILSMARLGRDMLETSDPPLKAAWVERGNPLLQSPDSINVRKAFAQMDFRIVVEQFITDTALEADIILPAKDMFEQTDIVGSYWSPYVQLKPKVVDPPGEVMPESELYYHLAVRLGFKTGNERIPEPGNHNVEKWLENRIKNIPEITIEKLRTGPVLPPGLQEIAYSDHVFSTPSGKIELLSQQASDIWCAAVLPGYTPVMENNEFPLVLLTPNAANRIHSQFGNLKIIKETTPEPATLISHGDARDRGIDDADQVRVFNNRGEIISRARISLRVPKGIIVLPNGIWKSEGGGGNYLIEGRETDMGHGAAFHDTRVEIAKATDNA